MMLGELHKAKEAWKPRCLEPKKESEVEIDTATEVELHKAKNPWKPPRLQLKKESEVEIDTATEELYKKTRSILNKLTPQKFQILLTQMQALKIDSENKLKGVVYLVFEKAISEASEPNFTVAYANMCRCLSMFKVQSDSKPGEKVNFRAVLLTRCQLEFKKGMSSDAGFVTKREEIEKREHSAKNEDLKQELQYEESKAQRRSLGNIRFMGELFKLKMLTENIMHDCVFKLLRTKDPENLKYLCCLISTIGKELNTDKAKPRMEQYFQQMSKIANDKKNSSRVRFMLQDVIDLRLNKWVPRRENNNPKTIDQIHKEVALENQKKSYLSKQSEIQQTSWRRGRLQPGPGGGAGKFSGWGRGSTGGASGRATMEKPRTPFIWAGIGERSKGRYRATDVQSKQTPSPPPSSSLVKALSADDMEKKTKAILYDYFQTHDLKEAITCVNELSAENHHHFVYNAINHVLERSSQSRRQTGFLLHDLAKQYVISVNSYIRGLVEVLEFAEDLESDIPNIWRCYGELISPMVHDGIIPLSFFKEASKPLIANNKAGILLAEILHDASQRDGHKTVARLWQASGLHWSDFVPRNQVDQFLKDKDLEFTKGGYSVSTTPTTWFPRNKISAKLDEPVVPTTPTTGLPLTDISAKLDEPVVPTTTTTGLPLIHISTKLDEPVVPTTPTTGLPLTDISAKLDELIVITKADNESVFDWIESNVDEPTTKRPKFIRALMTAVCNSAIKGEKGKERLEPKEISKRNDLLQKYLDHQPVSELQALYALQVIITRLEHPPGLLSRMLDTLYDDDIISEDAFFQWKKSEDEPEGKDATLKQAVQFFTWLKEAEDES